MDLFLISSYLGRATPVTIRDTPQPEAATFATLSLDRFGWIPIGDLPGDHPSAHAG